MIAPTAADVQEWTNLAELKEADAQSADRTVARANNLFKRITGLKFENILAEDEPLIEEVVQKLSESIWFDNTEERLETLSDWDLIQSFSAGPYSETRRSADEARKARMIHPWPALNALLWQLLSDDQRAWWEDFFSDGNAPAFEVTEMDWSGEYSGLGLSHPTGGILDPWEQ